MVKEHVIAWRRATLCSLCRVLDIDFPLQTGQFLQTTQENTTKLAYEGKIHWVFLLWIHNPRPFILTRFIFKLCMDK